MMSNELNYSQMLNPEIVGENAAFVIDDLLSNGSKIKVKRVSYKSGEEYIKIYTYDKDMSKYYNTHTIKKC